MVSIAILAGLLLVLATVFRQTSQMASQVRGGQAVFQSARQIYEALGRDLAGVTRDGFLFIRAQELKSGSGISGLVLYYDADGDIYRLNKGRTDVLVMSVAGAHNSAIDANQTSSMARVIWAQTERASGNNLAAVPDTPKYWATNFVLARHQTLMVPDVHSVDTSPAGYSGSNRGADFYNMSISDLTRFFGPAMGSGDKPHNRVSAVTYGLFRNTELAPYERTSKVWRFGRDGPGGDLTTEQVHSDTTYPDTSSYRGQERPKMFSPDDYHRMAAFGVASFQVDWNDGRRVIETDAGGNKTVARLMYYPAETPLTSRGNYNKTGPGDKYLFCWNILSPTSIRDTSVRTSFTSTATTYYRAYVHNPLRWRTSPSDWEKWNLNTQQMFSQYSSSGAGGVGRSGWPWPRALRVRLLIFDTTQDPPVGYHFEQVFHMLVQ